MPTRRLSFVAAAGVCLVGAASAQPSFNGGDLYLASAALEDPGGGTMHGILRIDPLTQGASLFPYTPTNNFVAQLSYDPFRDALIVVDSNQIIAVEADGTQAAVTPGQSAVRMTAPTGDGRIYFTHTASHFAYLDASNVPHMLLNVAGDADYQVFNIDEIVWDESTNSLFIADHNTINVLTLTRATLNPAGSQVVTETSVQIEISTSGEIAKGFSDGPGGSLFLKVDTNSNAAEDRMLTIDRVTLGVSVFATSVYFGVAGEVAGCYSPVNGVAVVLDSLGNQLRSFGQGTSGAGTIWPTMGVSAGGSGESAQLIALGNVPNPCPPDLNGDGLVDNGDIAAFVALFLGADLAADFNNDGILDNGDISAFIAAFLAGC